VNYFTKLFKKHTGQTPKGYRESTINFWFVVKKGYCVMNLNQGNSM
jgi:AraC-like DNA-binding protein